MLTNERYRILRKIYDQPGRVCTLESQEQGVRLRDHFANVIGLPNTTIEEYRRVQAWITQLAEAGLIEHDGKGRGSRISFFRLTQLGIDEVEANPLFLDEVGHYLELTQIEQLQARIAELEAEVAELRGQKAQTC